MRFIFVLFILLFLSGCGVESMYGISSDRWSNLSSEQHNKIIAGYEKVQGELEKEQANQTPNPNGKKIRVALYGGSVLMPPYKNYFRYEPITTTVTDGQCEYIVLEEQDGDNETKLGICYNHNVLQIDPSQFIYEKRHGTVALQYSPIWKRGFTYKHVTTSGYARLNNAHIYVLKMS